MIKSDGRHSGREMRRELRGVFKIANKGKGSRTFIKQLFVCFEFTVNTHKWSGEVLLSEQKWKLDSGYSLSQSI